MPSFTVNTKHLNESLKWVRRVGIPKRSSLPVLECVHLEIKDGQLFLTTTNLDVWATAFIPATGVCSPMLLNLEDLLSCADPQSDSEVTVEILDEGVKVTDGSMFGCKLPIHTMEDWPDVPERKLNPVLVGSAFDPGDVFKITTMAVSEDESRPELMNVCLEAQDGFADVVATNGYRMHHDTIRSGLWIQQEKPILFHGPLLKNLLVAGWFPKYTKRKPTKVNLFRVGYSYTMFTFPCVPNPWLGGSVTFRNERRTDYPAYRNVVPANPIQRMSIYTAGFTTALERASAYADSCNRKVVLQFGTKKVSIQAGQQGRGNVRLDLRPFTWDPNDFMVGFNASYLRDALSIFGKGSTVYLSQNDPISGAMIRCANAPDRWALVMPLRLEAGNGE